MGIELQQPPDVIGAAFETLPFPETPTHASAPSETAQETTLRYITACYRESREARLQVEPWWDEGWSLYNNEWDFTAKQAWQSQIKDSSFGSLVNDAAEGLKRATVGALKYFRIEAINPRIEEDVRYAGFFTELVHLLLRRANLFRTLSGAYKNAWITNLGVIRVTSERSTKTIPQFVDTSFGMSPDSVSMNRVTQVRSGIKLKDIDPYFLFPDPTGRNLYQIYEFTIDKYQLLDLTKSQPGFFNLDQLESLESGQQGDEQQSTKHTRIQTATLDGHPFRKPIRVWEFWGTILKDDGTVVVRDALAYVVDGRILIGLDVNPLLDGETPHVLFNIINQTDAMWGRSYSQAASSIAREKGHLLNLVGDAAKFAALKGFGIDLTALEDLEILKRGLYPGVVIPTRAGTNAIHELNFAGADQSVITHLFALQDGLSNAIGVSEFMTGRPSSRGRTTAGEFKGKMQRANELMESLGMDLEQSALTPLLQKSFYRIVEDFDFTDPDVLPLMVKHGLNPDEFRFMSAAMRSRFLANRYKFIATGLASYLSRNFVIENIVKFLQVAGNMGESNPQVRQKVEGLVSRLIDLLGLEEEPLLSASVPTMGAASGSPFGGTVSAPFPSPAPQGASGGG